MEQQTLARWLKCIIILTALCGAVLFAGVCPALGQELCAQEVRFAGWFWPWMIFIWGSAIPCYIVLFFAWEIASNIGADRSFSMENAKLLQWISALAAGDAAYFLAGNLILLLLSMNHPGVVLASFVVVFVGIAVAVASAALSHLVKKAAALQEQSDWTI